MSTPLIIHGIVPVSAPRPAGAPAHARIDHGAIAALVSPLALGADGSTDTDEALRHHAILQAYATVTDVAPARFGAVLADHTAVRTALARDAAGHVAALTRIAGCIEYGLRVTALPGRQILAPEPADGRGYLRSRLAARQSREAAQHQRADAIAAVQEAARCHARAVRTLPARHDLHPARLLDLAVLVGRDAAGPLATATGALADRLAGSGLTLVLTGPWPAYSFAASEDAAA